MDHFSVLDSDDLNQLYWMIYQSKPQGRLFHLKYNLFQIIRLHWSTSYSKLATFLQIFKKSCFLRLQCRILLKLSHLLGAYAKFKVSMMHIKSLLRKKNTQWKYFDKSSKNEIKKREVSHYLPT